MAASTTDLSPENAVGLAWIANPIAWGGLGLFLVILGGSWDVAWHVDIGRDSFWSPPHLLLYSGIGMVLASSGLALLKAWRERGTAGEATSEPQVALPFGLRMNAGLFMAVIGAIMALTSAPIDELWHRAFGLDVTIWSPPHLQLIFGLGLTALGLMAALAGHLNAAESRRFSATLPPYGSGLPGWGLHVLGAFFVVLLLAVVEEYQFDVPQYSIDFYPPVLAAVAVGGMMLTARAGGWRWSATIAGLLGLGVHFVVKGELILVGLGHVRNYPLALPVAGLVIDLVWGRAGQVFRAGLVIAVGALASAALIPAQLALMAWWDQLGWLPLAGGLVTGALGGVIGGRLGVALRPGLRGDRLQWVRRPSAGSGAAALSAIVVFLSLATMGSALRHGEPPAVRLLLPDPEVVAGESFDFTVQVEPAGAIGRVEDLAVFLVRADWRLRPQVKAAASPGLYSGSVSLPISGKWFLGVRVASGDEVWLDWIWLQVAARPGQVLHNQREYVLALQPPQTLPPEAVPQGWLLAGKALVSAWMVILLAVSLIGLRSLERHGLTMASWRG